MVGASNIDHFDVQDGWQSWKFSIVGEFVSSSADCILVLMWRSVYAFYLQHYWWATLLRLVISDDNICLW